MLVFYARFEVSDHLGEHLSESDLLAIRAERISELRKLVFTKFSDKLVDLAMASADEIETESLLKAWLKKLELSELVELCKELGMRTTNHCGEIDIDALTQSTIWKYRRQPRTWEMVDAKPIYPNEDEIFSSLTENLEINAADLRPAIPKINLQFLSLHDYVLRNYYLYRAESAFQIRQDVEDVVKRLQPRFSFEDVQKDARTTFEGWARMAMPLNTFEVTEVGKPKIGERRPSRVYADLRYDIGRYTQSIRDEWETVKKGDIVFLLSLRPEKAKKEGEEMSFRYISALD